MLTDVNGRPLNGNDPLEEISLKACGEEVQAILVKYNCSMQFVQLTVNGIPVDGGRLKVVKNKPIQQDHPAH